VRQRRGGPRAAGGRRYILYSAQVPEVAANSVAARAGLRAGDVILAVDGREVPASSTAVPRVVRAIMCARAPAGAPLGWGSAPLGMAGIG